MKTKPNTQPNIDTLRANLEAAKSHLETLVAAREALRPRVNYADAREAWEAYYEAYKGITPAKAAVTRAENKLRAAETGEPAKVRVFKYSVTLPCGRVVTRNSPRTYTHAIAAPCKDEAGWWCEGWAGSASLAAARVSRLVGYGYKAEALPVTIA